MKNLCIHNIIVKLYVVNSIDSSFLKCILTMNYKQFFDLNLSKKQIVVSYE